MIVTEYNNGDPAYYITEPRVELTSDPLDSLPVGYTCDITNLHSGDDGNTILDVGETWRWEVPVTVNVDTTFTAIGHGWAQGREDLGWDVTYDVLAPGGVIAFPLENFELMVQVTPGGEGFTPGYWRAKSHRDDWPPTG